MTKKEIRLHFRQRRSELTETQVRAYSQSIAQSFFERFPLTDCRFLHTFLPIEAFKEVNTFEIISRVWHLFQHCKVVIPKTNLEKNILTNSIFIPETVLQINTWGITEPIGGEEIASEKIDLVIVPLLAFDEQGYRVGYGKGFYDRFLAECRADALKIGVSFFEPIVQIADIHNGDIRLDYCITPQKVWRFVS